MSADEYLALGETQQRYELIDGVVCISPSADARHNEVLFELSGQLREVVRRRLVRVFPDTDVRFNAGVVYRPDLSIYRAERISPRIERLPTPPDVVIELLSPGSRSLDRVTKQADYGQFGVGEYWLIDPHDLTARVWNRAQGPWAEDRPCSTTLNSLTIPGVAIDLAAARDSLDA